MITTTSLGHDTRLSVWAEIGADEVYLRQYRTQLAEAPTDMDAARANFRLEAVEAHEADLWDCLANLQAI